MLNPKLKLNPKLFSEDVEKLSNRKGFAEGLLEAGDENQSVVALCADLTESTGMQPFAKKFPDRFIQVGVAEQNLVTVASGMSAMGKIPFCASYAVFSPGRNWEQIRTTITYNDRPVKIVGSHTGVTVGPDGGSHQMLEDIALMRVLPNIQVISPSDAIEAKKATLLISKNNMPTYLRLTREKSPIITTKDTPFEIGKAEIFWMPDIGLASVGIIATGDLVYNAIASAKKLEEKGIKTKVLNLSSIKPIDTEAIIALAKEAKAIVTVENHQIRGGVGGAVSEILALNYPVPIEFVGVRDVYGQSGTPLELIEHYGLGVKDIILAVEKVRERKI